MQAPIPQPFLVGTCLITSFRCVLFFSCRRYVDASLYQELKQESDMPPPGNVLELDALPPPTATPKARSSRSNGGLSSALARSLFSLCFSESCVLFSLLMCQAMDVFNARTRLLNWRISLFVLLVTILIIIPLSLSVVFTSSFGPEIASSPKTLLTSIPRLVTTIAPLFLYFFLLSYIPLPTALSASPEASSLLQSALSRLTVLGTVILGFLSGFGAVSNSWGYFPLSCGVKRKPPSQLELDRAEQSLERVRADIDRKREELFVLRRRDANQTEPSKSSSWLSRVTPNFRGDNELANVNTELSALSSLEDNMTSQVRWLHQRHAQAALDRTWRGRVAVLGRNATGIYCIFRSFTSVVNIMIPVTKASPDTARSYPDLLTSILIFILSFLPLDAAYTSSVASARISSVLRQANLGVIGVIIWSSVRRVLRSVARALRVTSRTLTASIVLLFLSQLMGIYLLSTLIQLRTSFPPSAVPENAGEATNLFSTLPEYQLFGPVFDWSFLLAAGAAAGLEWARSKNEDAEYITSGISNDD